MALGTEMTLCVVDIVDTHGDVHVHIGQRREYFHIFVLRAAVAMSSSASLKTLL